MTLTTKEADRLLALLKKIKAEANNPDRRKYSIENLCDKASLTIKKIQRKS